MTGPVVREGVAAEEPAILALYPKIFPDEDLRPVVSALLPIGEEVISLVAVDGGAFVGHVIFTLCGAAPEDRSAALLGPLGVVPERQKGGLGSALVRAGLERLAARGVARVFVLGDPGYYGRFGFCAEAGVSTPCAIPQEWASAWQSLDLTAGGPRSGRLVVPEPWMVPAYWSE